MREANRKAQDSSVWSDELSSSQVRQGDLFFFAEEQGDRRYGLAITADCDLSLRKHSKLVTLVPLLETGQVLEKCLYIDHLEYLRDRIGLYLKEKVLPDGKPGDKTFEPTIKARLTQDDDLSETTKLIGVFYCDGLDEINSGLFCQILKELGASEKKAIERFTNQLKSRGDILTLDKPDWAEDNVRIAWLRPIWQTRIEHLCLEQSAYEEGRNLGQYLAHLKSPFKYRLTQKLGQVFSDIGTPDLDTAWITQEFKEKHDA